MQIQPQTTININNNQNNNSNYNQKNDSFMDSTSNIFAFMKRKIPNFIFTLHLILYHNIFDKYVENNRLNTTYTETELVEIHNNLSIYLPLMALCCLIWELLHSILLIKNKTSLSITKFSYKYYIFCILNSLISAIVYIIIVFYIDSYNIIYNLLHYNKETLHILFYSIFILVILISFGEKVFCKKLL